MERRIFFYGDSIIDYALDPEKGDWGTHFKNSFEINNNKIELYNYGIPGNTSDDLLERFDDIKYDKDKPEVIVFAIGINDLRYTDSKDNPQISLDKFQENLNNLLKKAKERTDKIVFLGLTKINDIKTLIYKGKQSEFYYTDELAKKYNA